MNNAGEAYQGIDEDELNKCKGHEYEYDRKEEEKVIEEEEDECCCWGEGKL